MITKNTTTLEIGAAKEACSSLVYIIERTKSAEVYDSGVSAINALCAEFSITVFGRIPDRPQQ